MTNRSFNYDEIYDSAGNLLAPLGFGVSGDWETIESKIASGGALNFTDIDAALYEEFELVVQDLDTDTSSNTLILQFSANNGSSYDTGANYHYAMHRGNAETTFSEDSSTTATSILLSQNFGSTSVRLLHGAWRMSPLDSGSRKHIFGMCSHINDAGVLRNLFGSGMWAGTGSDGEITAFRLTLGAGGNFTGGRAILRGRRKNPTFFGAPTDWEVIDNQDDISAATTHDVFWADGVYDEIEVTISGLAIGTDNTAVEMTLSTDGSTFHTGATDYEWMRVLAHSAGTNPATGGSTGDSKIELHHGAGTGTDEELDIKITFKNVARTDKKKRCRIETEGNSADGLFRVNYGGGMLVVNNNSIRGFRIDPAGAVTFSADRIRVRGRRALTTQAVQTGDGDMVFMGEFNVATAGDSFIDVDMRPSVNPQFAAFTDTDFFVVVEGFQGPSNSSLFFRILQDGVAQSGASDYKTFNSGSASVIHLIAGTPGSGRRVSSMFTASGLNATFNDRVSLQGCGFSSDSGGGVIVGAFGGHNNGLAANTNNGMQVLVDPASDMDDLSVKVWALRKSS